MTVPLIHEQRPATAFVALVRQRSMGEQVQGEDLDRLIEAILTTPAERAALISVLADANTAELRVLAAHLFREVATQAGGDRQALLDADDVMGVWGLRISAGALLAGAGTTIVGTLTGGLAVAVVVASAVAVAGTGAGRLTLRRRARDQDNRLRLAETLAQSIDRLGQP